jgi:hypothetical protein
VKLEKNLPLKTYLIGVLCQTRGCGKPPPIVTLKSKIDFYKATTTPAEALPNWKYALLTTSVERVLKELPQEVFTGLSTKARVTVNTSACWERTVADGGTVQAIQDVVFLGATGHPCRIIDLETGKFEKFEYLSNLEPGEYIFWACLDEVLRTPIESLKEAYVVVVNEPGKARTVTKSHACLKVVLDLINKICAEPLRKGVPSSTSGMGKSSHGWNLFRECFKAPLKDHLFKVERQEEEVYQSFKRIRRWYKPIFVTSTDYKNATDYMRHDVSYIFGRAWMVFCGIPPVLRNLALETCFQPRTMVLSATGPLCTIGEYHSDTERKFTTSRGVMMGDPLTKIILHLTNIVSRRIATDIKDKSFIERLCPLAPGQLQEGIEKVMSS